MKTNYFVFLLLSIGLLACNTGKNKFTSADKIGVKWELLTNFTDEPRVFNAQFQLTNNSDQTLGANWVLFFNMSPRPILENNTPQPASLHHINGDWYKLVPTKDFVLEAGKTSTIGYRGTEAVIKATDQPLGLYFVFTDDEGNEEITEVTDYASPGFTNPDQINRSGKDEEPIPTPDFIYKSNLSLHEVSQDELLPVIPTPVRIKKGNGKFELNNDVSIYYQGDLESEANYLADALKKLSRNEIKITSQKPLDKSISLQLGDVKVNGVSHEANRLTTSNQGITITGGDAAGVFYGIQSLRAMIPMESYTSNPSTISIPAVTIEDAPRFGFRGLHLDVSRNFQTKESILRLLDLLSFYKVNRFLFYVTEDEGWRLEINDLPELTETGAQRVHTSGMEEAVRHAAYGSGPFAGKEGTDGDGY
jgi:hexosaminidase